MKEFESRITDAVKELDKPGGVGVTRLKKYFGEKFPEYHVEVKTYLLINALERLAGDCREPMCMTSVHIVDTCSAGKKAFARPPRNDPYVCF